MTRGAHSRGSEQLSLAVHARLLDVLHDPADDDVLAVVDRVHVELRGVVQELIDEPRGGGRGLDRLPHVLGELRVRVDDLHGAAAEHVARPHEHGVADTSRRLERLVRRARHAPARAGQPETAQQLTKSAAVLGEVDAVGGGAEQLVAGALDGGRQLQRGLPAKLHEHAGDLTAAALGVEDVEHALLGERLEVEAVAGVVVGGDRLRVAVDHHGLHARLGERERGVTAAVVELEPLADAVGSAPEDHDLLSVRDVRLALLVVEA